MEKIRSGWKNDTEFFKKVEKILEGIILWCEIKLKNADERRKFSKNNTKVEKFYQHFWKQMKCT